MKRPFRAFACAFLIIAGVFIVGLTYRIDVIKMHITCDSFLANLFVVIAVFTDILNLPGSMSTKKNIE